MSTDLGSPEFLIRQDKGDFTLRTLSSLEASFYFRPRCLSPKEVLVQESVEKGEKRYQIQNLKSGKILSLSQRGFELWNLMDGKSSLRSIAAAYFLKYGAFDFQEIRELLFNLKTNGFLEKKKAPLLQVHQFLSRSKNPLFRFFSQIVHFWISLEWRIPNVDAWITWLYKKVGRFLFSPVFVLGSFLLSSIATLVFIQLIRTQEITVTSFLNSPTKWLASYFLLAILIPIHELAHALATKHFGFRVREFGFMMLHHVFPVFFADVTDIWLAPPKQRMAVALAGPYSGWLLGSAAMGLVYLFPSLEIVFYFVAFYCFFSTLVNLYPFFFLELDGYYLWCDWVRAPQLKKESFQWLKKIVSGHWQEAFAKGSLSPACYAAFSLISIALFLGYIGSGFY